jgi:hypothetical protein
MEPSRAILHRSCTATVKGVRRVSHVIALKDSYRLQDRDLGHIPAATRHQHQNGHVYP